ncbi:YraN family protein [Sediminibacterium sp.]|uniref:YraN family protein n=1 Tax=Sediminibacterium sp. TaxID=1917865 RepID=UPI00272718C8|nr:YraN family protein [Sediminibacterium sp.]MDO9000373.1 YraN family protein [Bacteroidota bacterium]MDP3147058.1 YraN family protein [Bacteroidota bacterium]MDP3567406.1 YraN family protein [Sediminibacterium sp.]
MKNENSHILGAEGEKLAKKHLLANGYSILQENWRYKKYEIDIIASFKNLIVIIEVKARSTNNFGEPEAFVTKQKQGFLIQAANEYLISNNIDLECRFDIISVLDENNKIIVKHLEGAFYPSIK